MLKAKIFEFGSNVQPLLDARLEAAKEAIQMDAIIAIRKSAKNRPYRDVSDPEMWDKVANQTFNMHEVLIEALLTV